MERVLVALARDPEAAALGYFAQYLSGKSGASLACAVQAVRAPMVEEVRSRLAAVERLYLERLMETHDANEGLAAFIDKRAPKWEHR